MLPGRFFSFFIGAALTKTKGVTLEPKANSV
jgi:hypothetical protein